MYMLFVQRIGKDHSRTPHASGVWNRLVIFDFFFSSKYYSKQVSSLKIESKLKNIQIHGDLY